MKKTYRLHFMYSTDEIDDYVYKTFYLAYPELIGKNYASKDYEGKHILLNTEQAMILKLKFSDLDIDEDGIQASLPSE